MFVVGDNLQSLVEQHSIISDPSAFDQTSLTLRLAHEVRMLEQSGGDRRLTYGDELPAAWLKDVSIPDTGFLLRPHACVLACSRELVSMPLGYIGFVQTKGSLARLFVTVQCCDAQVDPGYSGKITFEIVNLGPMTIEISAGQAVAQLFIAKTTTRNVRPYNGRYQNAKGPTAFRKPL
jgi:dCTP deaminase